MDIDLRTAAFFIALVDLLAAINLTLFSILSHRYKSLWFWAGADLITCFAFILIGLRDNIGVFSSVVLANTAIFASSYLTIRGFFLLLEKKFPKLPFIFAILFVFIGFVYFTYFHDDALMRVFFSSIPLGIVLIYIGILLLRNAPVKMRFSYIYMGVSFLLPGIGNIIRCVVYYFSNQPVDILEATPFQVANFIVIAIVTVVWTTGIIFIVLQHLVLELNKTAMIDYLTGVSNRRAMQYRLDQEFAHAKRTNESFSILSLDLDQFKDINDECGHMVGDQVLCQLANVLKEETRQEDVIGRWGGDEFLVLLPDTPLANLSEITNRLRVAIKSIVIPCGTKSMNCTTSIGTGTYESEDENIEQCIVRADNALYKAKHLGGNRTVLG